MKSSNKSNNANFFFLTKDSKIWVESPITKTYSDEKEEPYFLVHNI